MSNCKLTIGGDAQNKVSELRITLINKDKDLGKKLTSFLQAGGINFIESVSQLANLNKTLESSIPHIIFLNGDGFETSCPEIIEQVNQSVEDSEIVIIDDNKMTEPLKLTFGSVSYLDKPLDFRKVENIIRMFLYGKKMEHIGTILDRLNRAVCPVRIKFSTRQGHVFIDPEEIVYLKADSNYTHIFLRDKKQVTVAKSLRNFDEGLTNSYFSRISRSIIINLNYLIELDRHQKMCLLKHNGQEFKLPITKTHVKSLLSNYLNC